MLNVTRASEPKVYWMLALIWPISFESLLLKWSASWAKVNWIPETVAVTSYCSEAHLSVKVREAALWFRTSAVESVTTCLVSRSVKVYEKSTATVK